jgi:hypothetical protein
MRRFAMVVLCWLWPAVAASAQQSVMDLPTEGSFQRWSPEVPGGEAALEEQAPGMSNTVGASQDHRREGALIGGGVTGLFFAVLTSALCSSSDSSDGCLGPSVVSGALGAALGGVTGLMIGAAIPKREHH